MFNSVDWRDLGPVAPTLVKIMVCEKWRHFPNMALSASCCLAFKLTSFVATGPEECSGRRSTRTRLPRRYHNTLDLCSHRSKSTFVHLRPRQAGTGPRPAGIWFVARIAPTVNKRGKLMQPWRWSSRAISLATQSRSTPTSDSWWNAATSVLSHLVSFRDREPNTSRTCKRVTLIWELMRSQKLKSLIHTWSSSGTPVLLGTMILVIGDLPE